MSSVQAEAPVMSYADVDAIIDLTIDVKTEAKNLYGTPGYPEMRAMREAHASRLKATVAKLNSIVEKVCG